MRPSEPGPDRIGPYRVLDDLGEGGMGRVYKARAPDGRLVAVKVVRPEYAAVAEFRRRFEREVASAVQVPRFCTAEVLGAAADGAMLYLVTEFIDGPTLHDSVRRDGPLRAAGLEQLGVSMAAALAAIHGAGVIHRDLKPGNVLLSRSGPRVIDFGIARALEGDGVRLTGTGHLVGTPGFVAPEQYQGGPLSPAVDVFAWGGVMTFAATGRYPFGGGEPHVIAYRVVHGEPDLDGVPAELRAVVSDALAKDPAARPAPAELQQRLGALPARGGRTAAATVHAPPAPQPPTARLTRLTGLTEPTGRRPRPAARGPVRLELAGAFLALLVAMLLGLGGDVRDVGDVRDARPPATSRPPTTQEPLQVFTVELPATLGGGRAGPGSGSIRRPGDTDVYRFTGAEGDRLFLEALTCSPTPAEATMEVTLTGPAGPVALERPEFCKSGTPVDPGGVVLPGDGRYELEVRVRGNGTGTYRLRLRPLTIEEFALAYGQTVTPGQPEGAGRIEAPGDVDSYRFHGEPGEAVTIAAEDCRLGSGVLRFVLWKPDATDLTGVVAHGELCTRGASSGQTTATLPVAGTYSITLDAGGHGDTGTYRLTVSRQ